MTRLLRIIVHNWPLKLAAVVLATLLYAGIVLSENVQTFPGSIPIQPFRQPANAVIVGNLPSVTNIRYVAPTDVAGRLTRDGFRATIDLSTVNPTPDNPFVTVRVDLHYADDRVRILDYSPQVISVRLDPLSQKTVPIQVDHGPVPSGLQLGQPVLSASTATVSGPDSIVRLVAAARAEVLIQSTGINVDQDVPLVAVDALGNEQGPADLEPADVHVQIRVSGLTSTKSFPVTPVVTGTPAPGYTIDSIGVSPPVVTVAGDANAIGALSTIATNPISVAGATQDVAAAATLALPDGVTVVGDAQVQLSIHVTAATGTQTFSVGIRLAGARSDRAYALSTSQVTATLGGGEPALAAVNGAALVAVADVGSLGPGNHTVRLSVRAPTGTTLVSLSPGTVVVTVAIPASPTPSAVPTPTPTPSGP
jgi:YbbR domain-containing protein